MTVSSVDRTDLRGNDVNAVQYHIYDVAASTTLYKGIMICTDAAGNANAAADTAGLVFQGISENSADNSSGSAGDKTIRVQPREALVHLELNAVSPDKTWIGSDCYVSDDNTVAITGVSNSIKVGQVVGIVKTGASGKVLVSTLR